MLRRDTYADYVTGEEMVDAGGWDAAHSLLQRRRQDLWRRSGAQNVTSSRLWVDHDLYADAMLMRVTFNSSAWTGR